MMGITSVQVEKKAYSSCGVVSHDLSRILMLLVLLVFASAFLLIYVKYENQQLYIKYNSLQADGQRLHQEGNMLTLEKATLSSHKRVYGYAEEAKMYVPSGKKIVVLD
ncbi:MAG: cell division protein FtsL [Legionellales bacterium]|jgi:cell division protein FtsL|nr:cell division protein FtsL [Legionellales bacterium]